MNSIGFRRDFQPVVNTEVSCYLSELFEGGFEVVDYFLGENVGIGKIVGFFAALLASRSNGNRSRPSEISIESRESLANRTDFVRIQKAAGARSRSD